MVMSDCLSHFGIETVLGENSVRILPGTLHAPETALSSHNDHRIVMALALLMSITGGTIENAQAVSKSYPDFFGVLTSLGLEVTDEAQ